MSEALEIPVFANSKIDTQLKPKLKFVPILLPVENKPLRGFCKGKARRAPKLELVGDQSDTRRGILRILRYIGLAPRTSDELQKLTGLTKFTVERHLKTLQSEGLVDVVGKRVMPGVPGSPPFLWGLRVKPL